MSLPQSTPNALYGAIRSKTFATVAADITFATDTQLASPVCRFIRVGTAGDLTLVYGKDDAGNPITDTLLGVTAGELLRVLATGILASGTTAAKVTVFVL